MHTYTHAFSSKLALELCYLINRKTHAPVEPNSKAGDIHPRTLQAKKAISSSSKLPSAAAAF